jgi:hypothetical protein
VIISGMFKMAKNSRICGQVLIYLPLEDIMKAEQTALVHSLAIGSFRV